MAEIPPEFIELVVVGWRQKSLASRFGVSDRTIRRWLTDPQVALLVTERREEVECAIVGRLSGMADDALDTLASLLTEGSDSVRLRAAQMVLEQVATAHRTLADRQADTYQARIFAATPASEFRIPADEDQST